MKNLNIISGKIHLPEPDANGLYPLPDTIMNFRNFLLDGEDIFRNLKSAIICAFPQVIDKNFWIGEITNEQITIQTSEPCYYVFDIHEYELKDNYLIRR